MVFFSGFHNRVLLVVTFWRPPFFDVRKACKFWNANIMFHVNDVWLSPSYRYDVNKLSTLIESRRKESRPEVEFMVNSIFKNVSAHQLFKTTDKTKTSNPNCDNACLLFFLTVVARFFVTVRIIIHLLKQTWFQIEKSRKTEGFSAW